MQTCEARFLRVVDGDTAHLDVVESASGVFHTKHWLEDLPYRFARINAPELSTEAGKASAAALTAKVKLYPATGWTVITGKRDPYGRYIAEVIAPDATNLSDWMVAQGLAAVVIYRLDAEGTLHPYNLQGRWRRALEGQEIVRDPYGIKERDHA